MSSTMFLLALGATCRITRFLTKDTLAGGLRIWVADRFGEESKAAYLITCGWCSSVWVSAVAVGCGACLEGSPWFRIPATALSVSYLTGLASRWLD
ncbi:hypothetical protein [Kitasatospora aureofaciens]|uniref:hypothetical protein n=1 Tax=Kitasatospora aureofaciens TaxID=1894 RepID=UPI0005252660|nr:hypothetical protein [Kitasatospora aureofaciens]